MSFGGHYAYLQAMMVSMAVLWLYSCSAEQPPKQKNKSLPKADTDDVQKEDESSEKSDVDDKGDDDVDQDDSAPPSLLAFSAESGEEDGVIQITLEFPQDVTEFDRVSIKAAVGDLPPEDCTQGDKLKTLDDFSASEIAIKAPIAGETYSLRACVYDAAGNEAADQPTAASVVAGSACAGKRIGKGCWYLGEPSKSCEDTCSPHGGYNELTNTYAGRQGTIAQCKEVLEVLFGQAITKVEEGPFHIPLGCHQFSGHSYGYVHGVDVDTSAGASWDMARRACACNI